MPKASTAPSGAAAHWLNPKRLRVYCGAILLASLIYLVRCARYSQNLYGHPNGFDFTTFWAASRLWLEGRPLAAYSFDALIQAAKQISPRLPALGPFFYPPNFLLLLKPLAWLPSPVSYAVFEIVTAGILVILLRKLLPMRDALLPIIAFPGIWLTVAQGQNSCITAALALGTFMNLQKRPVLAGICIGMLSIKPHLAILFPLALACAGMWTAFIAAGVTAALFTGIALAVFGLGAIPPFMHGMSLASEAIALGRLPWNQTASLFATLRLAHAPLTAAYAAQGCQALAATAAVIRVWRRSGDLAVRATALVAATCMISPYIFNYDTTWLAAPLALYAAKGLRDGWLPWEREVLCVAWLYPALGDLCGMCLGIGIGPFMFAALLALAIRRAHHEQGTTLGAPRAHAEPQPQG
jgi:hypothetical protein